MRYLANENTLDYQVLIISSKSPIYGNSATFSTLFTQREGGWVVFIYHGWLMCLVTVTVVTECLPKEVEKRKIDCGFMLWASYVNSK